MDQRKAKKHNTIDWNLKYTSTMVAHSSVL